MTAKRIIQYALLLVLAIPAACGERVDSQPASGSLQPPLTAAESVTVDSPLSVPAQTYVEQDTWLYARATGVLDSLLVDLGSTVRAGEVVARLESDDQAIALQRAEVAVDAARRDVDRARALAQSKNIATADLETAESAHRQAELARMQARRALDFTRIIAPFAGVVAARSFVRVGRLVAPGDSIVRVTALSPLRAAVHVPEGHARGLRIGSKAWVSGSGGEAIGTIIRAAPTVDAASGTYEFVLELAPGSSLRPGAAVSVRLGGERRRVLAIPAAAVADSGYVIVWTDGRSALRSVTLGARLPNERIEVITGLSAGERVATSRR